MTDFLCSAVVTALLVFGVVVIFTVFMQLWRDDE